MIGVYIQEPDARAMVEAIRLAESKGVPAFWLTMGGTSADATTIFGAAAMVTERIKLGTSIIPTWPRHPVALAQQCLALASLAPGRFRLGIGPSHHTSMGEIFGVDYRYALTNLREYLTVLTTLLRTGEVQFEGRFVKTATRLPGPVDVPVMASALRPASFELCGELADGAISWVSPWPYLRDVALPAMKRSAAAAGRATPPLVAHQPVFFGANKEDMLARSRAMLGRYATLPNYQGMMTASGHPDAPGDGIDAFLEALVVYGDDASVVEQLGTRLGEGAGEVIVHPVFASGDNTPAYRERVFELVAAANRAVGG